MNLLEELKELRNVFLPWLWVWLLLSFFFFGFGFQKIKISGLPIYYPSPSLNSISAYFLKRAQKDLLPEGVKIVTLDPLNVFLSLVFISILLAFLISFPFFLYKLIKYLNPALYPKEKKTIFKILIPTTFLFIAGCIFSYFLIIPITFKLLYAFAITIGAEPFFKITDFISLVLGLMVVVGIIFLLPIFMVLLSHFGIVNEGFWRKNWRYAVFSFLVFSAIITPDGTGITMMLLSLPMTALYLLGMILAKGRKI
jgi:sec-independent protein translocase protein TatC